MSDLYMNVDSCRSASGTIQSSREQMDSQLQSVTNLVNNMVPTDWRAPGADQFKNEFTDWGNKMKQLLTDLTELKGRLDREVAEWEATGGKFG